MKDVDVQTQTGRKTRTYTTTETHVHVCARTHRVKDAAALLRLDNLYTESFDLLDIKQVRVRAWSNRACRVVLPRAPGRAHRWAYALERPRRLDQPPLHDDRLSNGPVRPTAARCFQRPPPGCVRPGWCALFRGPGRWDRGLFVWRGVGGPVLRV